MNIYFLFTLSEFHCAFPGVRILWGIWWCLRHFLPLLNVASAVGVQVLHWQLECTHSDLYTGDGTRRRGRRRCDTEISWCQIFFWGIYYYYVFMHTLLNLIEKITQRVCIYIYIYRDIPSKNQNVYIFFLFKRSIFSRKKQLKHFFKKIYT